MIIDLNEVDTGPLPAQRFDICICGGGVAGIVLANKLSKRFNVVVLEGGGLQYSDESQSVYEGSSIGHSYYPLTATRLRFFGGTSNHWAGYCLPLDEHDFLPNENVDLSGWPIAKSDLDPYLDEAKTILSVNDQSDFQGEMGWEDAAKQSGDFYTFRLWKSDPPTRFGQEYLDDFKKSENPTCYINANLTDIALDEASSRVKEVEVRNFTGTSFTIAADAVIIAAGGIENPRILLNCNRQIEDGLGNSSGLVGRFFMEHFYSKAGEYVLEDHVLAKAGEALAPGYPRLTAAPTLEFMKRERTLNYHLSLQPYQIKRSSDGGFKAKLRSLICASDMARDLVKDFRGKEMPCPTADGRVHVGSELALNPSSRITLGKDVDKFGQRRVVLDWRLSEIDKHTIRTAVQRIGEILARQGLGRVRIADWLQDEGTEFPTTREGDIGGHHHMCTTRMGHSAKDGVVDSDQKVFGIDNLYVAGSSAFATGGHANPTFTIVQMSLRLADHLKNKYA